MNVLLKQNISGCFSILELQRHRDYRTTEQQDQSDSFSTFKANNLDPAKTHCPKHTIKSKGKLLLGLSCKPVYAI